jgi:hypothetical protein
MGLRNSTLSAVDLRQIKTIRTEMDQKLYYL